MAKTDFQSVDEYLATFPSPVRSALREVRSALRDALPEAEEGVSYQIPVYKLQGAPVIFFAGFANHYSLFGADMGLETAFAKELARYKRSGRGTIQFPLDEPVPVALIKKLARHRARKTKAWLEEKEKARAAKASAKGTKGKPAPRKTAKKAAKRGKRAA